MAIESESPTGKPLIPPAVVPWLALLGVVAEVVSYAVPPHTVAAQVAAKVVSVMALLGLASPGWRRRP